MNGDGSIRLQIPERSFFEPQSSIETGDSNLASPSSPAGSPARAPEKKLTLFALRLAILEKAATGLGTLGFIWATVVLLGGFAITLDKTDFWFITVILLIEGTRIFSRSHELEWQHQATWSITEAGIYSFRALKSTSDFMIRSIKSIFCQTQRNREIARPRIGNCPQMQSRKWRTSDVPLLPYVQWVFLSRNISKLLYWLQLLSATACVVLSLMKLIKHNYGEVAKGDTDKRNRQSALTIFYSLALAEALLFLAEKAYWEWKVSWCDLLETVNLECELGCSGLVSVRRFFYDAYSKCINGSIFDGLKMDMVSFALELVLSNSSDEQLIGARILRQFAMSARFSEDTLQKIGLSLTVMERLVEILNWNDPQEEEIRKAAAEIISKLAGKQQNCLRVAGIPGAMESISSLLHINRTPNSSADEICEKKIAFDHMNYGFSTFNNLGLLILKQLARNHDNCGKIGNTRGLLPKIIDFTHAEARLLKNETAASSQINTVKLSLQLVKMLARTTGNTGKQLRKEISEIVFTISNMRDILRHGEKHPNLQKLSIKILTHLAYEEDARERIGGTGGVLKELFNIFFKEGMAENQKHVRIAAGEAVGMLALENEGNCRRILRLQVMEKLVGALELPLIRVGAARILRNLCTYSEGDCFDQLKGVTAAGSTVLKAILSEKNKTQEVMVGLASHVFRFMTSIEANTAFEKAGIKEVDLANALIQILKKHPYPPIKTPRIRRFVIELAIWMMRDKQTNIQIFKTIGLETELEGVIESTGEVESFNVFSGTVGLSRHGTTIHSLVETAMKLMID